MLTSLFLVDLRRCLCLAVFGWLEFGYLLLVGYGLQVFVLGFALIVWFGFWVCTWLMWG